MPLFILALFACSTPEAPVDSGFQQSQGKALGTTWSVKWSGPATVEQVDQAVNGALALVDQRMSTWRDDSELQQVRKGGVVAVSEDTAFVVQEALSLAEATGGAFDPTVQPLMELWGFHSRDPLPQPPSEAEITAALDQVGFGKVEVAEQGGTWTVDAGGTALDLSAIAKGHASDRVAEAIAGLGAEAYMVEVGGEVRVKGKGPSGVGWRLAVDAPVEGAAPGQQLAGTVTVTDHGVATSGNYRNRRRSGGQSWGHTMDPRKGRPVPTPVLSVTVIAEDARTADGWATALMVMGPEGLELVEQRKGLEAVLLLDGEAGVWTVRQTSGASRYFKPL